MITGGTINPHLISHFSTIIGWNNCDPRNNQFHPPSLLLNSLFRGRNINNKRNDKSPPPPLTHYQGGTLITGGTINPLLFLGRNHADSRNDKFPPPPFSPDGLDGPLDRARPPHVHAHQSVHHRDVRHLRRRNVVVVDVLVVVAGQNKTMLSIKRGPPICNGLISARLARKCLVQHFGQKC